MKHAWQQAARKGIGQIRKNARQALFALMTMSLFLAGSCRLPERQAFFGPETMAAEVRATLFSNWSRDGSVPAAGYISQARDFISADPTVLSALTEREIRLVFGSPVMSRNEGLSGLWQYQSTSCTLNIYYGGGGQVLGYGVWSRTPVMQAGGIVDVRDQDDASCIKEVIEDPQIGQSNA